MKRKKKKKNYPTALIAVIIIASLSIMPLSLTVLGRISSLQMLKDRIVDSRHMLSETGVSYAGDGSDVPSSYRYWSLPSHRAEFEAAVEEAESFVAGVGQKNTLEAGGARVRMEIEHVGNGMLDVALILEENPGMYTFSTDIVFDHDVLNPVSITEFELQGFSSVFPPLDGGRYPDRRMFISAVLGRPMAYSTGMISVTRMEITGEINYRKPPVTLGHLNVAVEGMQEIYVSTKKMNCRNMTYLLPSMNLHRMQALPKAETGIWSVMSIMTDD